MEYINPIYGYNEKLSRTKLINFNTKLISITESSHII